MARPKKAESIRRTSNVMVRFSSIEYELVAGYAKDAGYPISTFVRKQALSEKVTVNYNIVADLGEIQNLTINDVEIKKDLSQRERMVDFISQIKNPYCYLDKGMVVKISFAGENRLEDTLKKCARTHMR